MERELMDELRRVKEMRIAFLHHSVGKNIIDGMKLLCDEAGFEAPTFLPVVRAAETDGPCFSHWSGGRNKQPISKVDSFTKTLSDLPGLEPAVAFLKFCYVDFNPDTNVKELFTYYRGAMDELEERHSRTEFLHVTVPLTIRPEGPKEKLYRLMGRQVWADASNEQRRRFNDELKRRYGEERVFDLATVESTGPDGEAFSDYSLHPSYTDDGGHLNERGQRIAARAMIEFLARTMPGVRIGSH